MTTVTMDFETLPIEGNPLINPPRPIGVGIQFDDKPIDYVTGRRMEELVRKAFKSADALVFHNAPFDIAVAERWIPGVQWPRWERVHDTSLLAYLRDPHAPSLALKDLAVPVLKRPPGERDELRDWIFAHVSGALRKPSAWGAHIHLAAQDPDARKLVERYCIMDVELTRSLYDALKYKNRNHAYDLERRLMPRLVETTRRGVRLNIEGLEMQHQRLGEAIGDCRGYLHLELGTINLNSAQQLVAALEARYGIPPDAWPLTAKGNPSTDKKALIATLRDQKLLEHLLYYRAATKLQTYCKGWLEQAVGGRIHPSWHQTRGDNDFGTRTGRLSSSQPNFQNVPNPLGTPVPRGLPELPQMKRFILPREGETWISMDYDAQEMRLLAHFTDGKLAEEFRQDPDMDPHAMVRDLIKMRTGRDYARKAVKGVGFGILYGMGNAKLANQLGITKEQATQLREIYLGTLPEVKAFARDCQRGGIPVFDTDDALETTHPSVQTLNQRTYKGEPGYLYKLLNYRIQGSAADQTKRALVKLFDKLGTEPFLTTVHDEINISASPENFTTYARDLRDIMEEETLCVPVRTTAEAGPNWGQLQPLRLER